MTCYLLINTYEKARSISTTIYGRKIVVVLHFVLEKIESFSTLIHKKHKTHCVAIKIIFDRHKLGFIQPNCNIKGPSGQFGSVHNQICPSISI